MPYEFSYNVAGDQDRFARLPGQMGRLINDALNDISRAMEGEAKAGAGFQTGNLLRNITQRESRRVGPSTYEGGVGVSRTAPYGLFTHEGTGLFGRVPHLITPKRSRFMVFPYSPGRPPGPHVPGKISFVKDGMLFTTHTRGQRANPFMRRAFENVKRTYVPARIARLEREIQGL